jgi:hypothetical protein
MRCPFGVEVARYCKRQYNLLTAMILGPVPSVAYKIVDGAEN